MRRDGIMSEEITEDKKILDYREFLEEYLLESCEYAIDPLYGGYPDKDDNYVYNHHLSVVDTMYIGDEPIVKSNRVFTLSMQEKRKDKR